MTKTLKHARINNRPFLRPNLLHDTKSSPRKAHHTKVISEESPRIENFHSEERRAAESRELRSCPSPAAALESRAMKMKGRARQQL